MRITEITVGNHRIDFNNPEEMAKTYKLTSTYHVGNWNPLFSGRKDENVTDGKELRVLLADYIKKEGSVRPDSNERIKIA